MFNVIYVTESQSLSNIKVDLKPGRGLYYSKEDGNTFKAQIEIEVREQLGIAEDDYLHILSIEYIGK